MCVLTHQLPFVLFFGEHPSLSGIPRWVGRTSQKVNDAEGKTHSAAGEKCFLVQPFPPASRPCLSWGNVLAHGGHSNLTPTEFELCLQRYLGRTWILEATQGALWSACETHHTRPSAPSFQLVLYVGRERGQENAETLGTRLLVSWENSDKNLSQVL